MKWLDSEEIKQFIDPNDFYLIELPDMPTPGPSGWKNGGLCPFHDDRKPNSFYVNIVTGAFKCFSCGTSGGDIIQFTQLKEDITFREALEKLDFEW